MKQRFIYLLVFVAPTILCSCGGGSGSSDKDSTDPGMVSIASFYGPGLYEEHPDVIEDNQNALVISYRAFVDDLLKKYQFDLELEEIDDRTNFALSPYSLYEAYLQLLQGTGQRTRNVVQQVIHSTLDDAALASTWNRLSLDTAYNNPGLAMQTESILWGQRGYLFSRSFLESLANSFDVQFHSLDFISTPEAAKQSIQNMLAEFNDRFRYLFYYKNEKSSDLDVSRGRRTRMVTTNISEFSIRWEALPGETVIRKAAFESLEGDVRKEVDTLFYHGLVKKREHEIFTATALPTGSDDLELLLLTPKQGTSLESLRKLLSYSELKNIHNNLVTVVDTVTLPLVTISSDFSPSDLSASALLGSNEITIDTTVFEQDFPLVNNAGYLFLNDFSQNTFMEFSEHGGDFHGATIASYLASNNEPPELLGGGGDHGLVSTGTFLPPGNCFISEADSHPFLFFIISKSTHLTLMYGQVMRVVGENIPKDGRRQEFFLTGDPDELICNPL